MTLRHEFAIILVLTAACGDNEGPGTASSTSGPTTTQVTGGPSTLTTSDGASTSTNTSSDPSGDTMNMQTVGTTSTGENAPVFLTFSANPTAITEGESVTFTAILTDPDGVSDIVGGSLLSADGATEFGPFVAAGQQGTYTFTLSWAQVHQAIPIQFENSMDTRMFGARFFDQTANSSTKTVSVNLQCASGSACDGACKDLDSDTSNCGTCAHSCALSCASGKCGPSWSECIGGDDGFSTCDQVCQSIGETCAESQCEGATQQTFQDLSWCENDDNAMPAKEACSKVQGWANPAIKCCCTSPE